MSNTVIFYEKPGCISNGKQKALLRSLGHDLSVHNLLAERWTPERLRPFFGDLPVRDWFNPTAPRIKAGEVKPDALDETTALALMLDDPLLIRRPLIASDFGCGCGFASGPLLAALGVHLQPEQDFQSCSQTGDDPKCDIPTGSDST
ncbi:ArsC/Spx/MgsR family protein [Thiorhodovibrio frisius]|uniref:Nitrogenase-associated protein n=1 Tax=Thiorhodovibrio frisius TaxID=631362 RepID=H8Z607_9GAMM|nr:ArsC/Spx/MgsR family protein [Thiorhodovibrio frisius]EIC20657.1 nitrogenase-associated protein [Thiorhodovibrio frisius]WPL21405.1 nitrogenase-associated protein [Thiorhodovibrio frisius]